MTTSESRNHARRYLQTAQEYLASAEDNLDPERATPAAGDAIHAGTSAQDATGVSLTGTTSNAKDYSRAPRELRQALGARSGAAAAEKAHRELVSAKGDVEYGTTLVTLRKAAPLVRRAHGCSSSLPPGSPAPSRNEPGP